MTRDYQKEEDFYLQKFNFSYSSLNKLLYSPFLFYKDYILQQKEERTEKHLIEGKLLHCLLFEPDKLNEKFNIVPGKVPADSVKSVLNNLKGLTKIKDITSVDPILDSQILQILKNVNLYQSLKEDSARLEKIKNTDNQQYWEFLINPSGNIIDNETLTRVQSQLEILKSHPEVSLMLSDKQTDFELDPIKVFVEKFLETDLINMPFGLKGIIDYYKIDSQNKEITICDLKTTSKTITEFPETIEFYKYWLQAAIYYKLVISTLTDEEKNYTIRFKFAVIDIYNQVYLFTVSNETMTLWGSNLFGVLKIAEHHYNQRDYSLPYQFLTTNIYL